MARGMVREKRISCWLRPWKVRLRNLVRKVMKVGRIIKRKEDVEWVEMVMMWLVMWRLLLLMLMMMIMMFLKSLLCLILLLVWGWEWRCRWQKMKIKRVRRAVKMGKERKIRKKVVMVTLIMMLMQQKQK